MVEWLPADFTGVYHEPFCGSAALFFALQPPRAILSDANTRLTRTHGAVRHELPAVLEALRIYAAAYTQHGEAFYYHVRDHWVDEMADAEMAAAFIFLNKTGFNGLYRANAAGRYNVPAGKFTSPPTVCDEARLTACSKALANATIINCDFREVERRAQPGDLVYFDSPYVPVSSTSDFTTYTAEGFGHAEQVALRDLAARLKKRGVHVLLSNSSAPIVRELYAAFEIKEISRSGQISSKTDGRQAVTELLIR
jgi:DNA adenine methylase